MDLLFVVVALAFFAITIAAIAALERL